MPLGPNDPVPEDCRECGHLAMQHTRTPLGKRCIGNQWRCKCGQRPLSMVIMLPKVGQSASTPPVDAQIDFLNQSIANGEYV